MFTIIKARAAPVQNSLRLQRQYPFTLTSKELSGARQRHECQTLEHNLFMRGKGGCKVAFEPSQKDCAKRPVLSVDSRTVRRRKRFAGYTQRPTASGSCYPRPSSLASSSKNRSSACLPSNLRLISACAKFSLPSACYVASTPIAKDVGVFPCQRLLCSNLASLPCGAASQNSRSTCEHKPPPELPGEGSQVDGVRLGLLGRTRCHTKDPVHNVIAFIGFPQDQSLSSGNWSKRPGALDSNIRVASVPKRATA